MIKHTKIIPDFQDRKGRFVKTSTIFGVEFNTKSYMLWRSMTSRCATGCSYQRRKPTYSLCRMSDNFEDFQYFTDWHTRQAGYGLKDYQLDKDILFKGNKLYSEDTCVLIPRGLNMFLAASDAIRGEFPQGVSFHRKNKTFVASIKANGESKYIGSFATPELAHDAYVVAKEAEARNWYYRLLEGEYAVDARVIERMRVWKFEDTANIPEQVT